jgi:Holliday junction resolvase RusA-like endonuclease
MSGIRFFVAGTPKAMQTSARKRVPVGGGKFTHLPEKRNAEWGLLVGYTGRQHAPGLPLTGPIRLAVTFYVVRPASANKRVLWPLKRPDVDNLVHKLTDQWNGVFWHDDSQIVELVIRKRFAESGGNTGAAFAVEPVEGAP